jgi:hypothetical protein
MTLTLDASYDCKWAPFINLLASKKLLRDWQRLNNTKRVDFRTPIITATVAHDLIGVYVVLSEPDLSWMHLLSSSSDIWEYLRVLLICSNCYWQLYLFFSIPFSSFPSVASRHHLAIHRLVGCLNKLNLTDEQLRTHRIKSCMFLLNCSVVLW